jgi:hypothetical protein
MYARAPASSAAVFSQSQSHGGGGGSNGMSPTHTAPQPPLPQLTHQPFSAPSNPYSGAAIPEKVVDEPETMVIEEKDLPDKPKGRERSLTNKSRDGGKKSVFGFMTGELNGGPRLSRRGAWVVGKHER